MAENTGSKKGILATPTGDRPLYKRMTVRGAALLAALQVLEDQQMIPMGLSTTLADLGQVIGTLIVGLGAYRHIPTT